MCQAVTLGLMGEIFSSIYFEKFPSYRKVERLQCPSAGFISCKHNSINIHAFFPESFESELYTLWYFTPNHFRLYFLKVTAVPRNHKP